MFIAFNFQKLNNYPKFFLNPISTLIGIHLKLIAHFIQSSAENYKKSINYITKPFRSHFLTHAHQFVQAKQRNGKENGTVRRECFRRSWRWARQATCLIFRRLLSTLRSKFLKEKISREKSYDPRFSLALFFSFSFKVPIRVCLETKIGKPDSRIILAYPRRGENNPVYDFDRPNWLFGKFLSNR